MKRKLLCLIMVLTLAFAEISANANALNGEMNLFVDKISEMTSEDRTNLISLIYPMLIIDDGIDTIVQLIDEYQPGDSGMISGYIADILKYTTKEDASFLLNSIKIIPEDIRQEYIEGFIERKEFELSDEGKEYISEFLKITYDKFPKLEKIFKDDGVTSGTLAQILTSVPKVNGNMPLLAADSEYKFEVYYMDENAAEKWKIICEQGKKDGDLKASVNTLAQNLNGYEYDSRKKLALLFSELGLCYIYSGDEPAYKNIIPVSEDRISYPAVYAYFKDGDMLFRTEMAQKNTNGIKFDDINGWYRDCITELAYMGIVSGRGDGMFYPEENVTREEFVKMICGAVNLPSIDATVPFADVDNDAWYGRYVRTAYYYKIIKGQSEEAFGTGQNIRRQDVAVICDNIIKSINAPKINDITFKDDSDISDYARSSVYNLAQVGIINGDTAGNFNPQAGITRGESAKIINELIYLISKSN